MTARPPALRSASEADPIPADVARYVKGHVRSTRDLRAYLSRRGFTRSVAARLLARLKTLGVVDDTTAARLWVEQWAREGYAWAAIRVRLSAKGFDARAIRQAAGRDTAADDRSRAFGVVAERLRRAVAEGGQPRTDVAMRQRARLARRLAARGFDCDLIEQVLDESLGRQPSD